MDFLVRIVKIKTSVSPSIAVKMVHAITQLEIVLVTRALSVQTVECLTLVTISNVKMVQYVLMVSVSVAGNLLALNANSQINAVKMKRFADRKESAFQIRLERRIASVIPVSMEHFAPNKLVAKLSYARMDSIVSNSRTVFQCAHQFQW